MTIETQLRDTLHRAAGAVDPGQPAGGVRAEGMRLLARRRSQRRTAILAASAAVLLLTAAIPVGLGRLQGGTDRVAAPASADIYEVPTRGTLATDPDFVEAVRELSWAVPGVPADAGIPDAPLASRHVVFAGDVTGGLWALVVGTSTAPASDDPDAQTDARALAGTWFAGPVGATPAQMQLVGVPHGIAPDLPASLYNGVTGALVVVAAPGDVIAVSARPEVAADASVTREFAAVDTTDGVSVTAGAPNPYFVGEVGVQYRVSRAGSVVVDQAPDGFNDQFGTGTMPPIMVDYLRPPVAVLRDDELAVQEQRLAAEVLGGYGLQPDEVGFTVLYEGPIPGRVDATAGLIVLNATFPSGAVLTQAEWAEQSGGGMFLNGFNVIGAEETLAFRCDVGAGVGDGQLPAPASTLVVIAPLALAGAQATLDTTTFTLGADGVGMVPFPFGAAGGVRITAADGSTTDVLLVRT